MVCRSSRKSHFQLYALVLSGMHLFSVGHTHSQWYALVFRPSHFYALILVYARLICLHSPIRVRFHSHPTRNDSPALISDAFTLISVRSYLSLLAHTHYTC